MTHAVVVPSYLAQERVPQMSETPIYDLLVSVRAGTRPAGAEGTRTTEITPREPLAGRGAHQIPEPRSSGRHRVG
jgi:hypothetical protein